ncbi:hypothetical protein PC110_g5494 [Phytophthora cactorum]|uniref:HAT C-terminal dimerisation domain-containing protein n=1 Tax=Phytophthora cactorum TaxID=29920 RepID=A0A329SNW7_9STRA|nr:hypothetical protein PC110_g5494 [Phytophthora cactorum]
MSSLSPPSPSSSTSGSQQPVVDPLPPDRRGGRPQDPIWDEVLVEDGIVSCLKCEKIIHTSGKTHVERVRYHFEKKCSKRLNTPLITSDFVKQLEKALAILSVLSTFQKAFEKNTKPPSDVYRMFLELPEQYNALSIPISDLGKIGQILKERFDFIYGDAHGVAYLLDPRYLGQNMDDGTREQVQSFITHGQQSVEVTLVYKKKLPVFQYWNGRSQFPLLRDVALTVFSANCSSAAAERNFSAHKFVHSQARNRLQDASVEKLVFLFFNAKNFDNEDMAFYEMTDDLADASVDEDSSNEDSDFEYY